MLSLVTGTDADVVNPAPQRPSHVHRSRRAEGQDSTSSFLSHPALQHVLVQVIAFADKFLSLYLQLLLSKRMNVVNAVLPVLFVLPAEPRAHLPPQSWRSELKIPGTRTNGAS